MAVIALDLGQKRIGVAVSRSGRLVEPVGVWPARPQSDWLRRLQTLVADEQIDTVVVGAGQAEPSLQTAIVQATGAKIVIVDESLSTNEARRRLGRKDHADEAAAAIILERFLDGQS